MSLSRRDFLLRAAAGVVSLPLWSFAADGGLKFPETIRVGLIGLEGHYSDITSAAKTISNIRFTAIADANEDRLKSARRNTAFANARVYTDYRKLLATETLDVVGVCGENGSRAEILRACAER